MFLTASEVLTLSSPLDWWELGEYISASVVIIAVAGEYIADFTNWFTQADEAKKKRLGKRSTILLIAGLAMELLCLVRTSQLSGNTIAVLNRQAREAERIAKGFEQDIAKAREGMATAKQETARLASIAEGERLARIEIEARLAPRRIGVEQRRKFAKTLSPYPGTLVELATPPGDSEAADFGADIRSVLTQSNWIVSKAVMHTGSNIRGVGLVGLQCAVNEESAAGRALVSVLKKLPNVSLRSTSRLIGSTELIETNGKLSAPRPVVATILVGLSPPAYEIEIQPTKTSMTNSKESTVMPTRGLAPK
jgi:hypothetical protein